MRLRLEMLLEIRRCLLLGFLGLAMSIASAHGQEASLHGHVADETGAPVSEAAVDAAYSSGLKQTGHSDEAGNFEIPSLPPGLYKITVSKPGFFLLKDQQFELKEGSNDISFNISHEYEAHESVEVMAPSQQVEPAETNQQQTLEAHQILNLPLPKTHNLQTYLPSLPAVLIDNSGVMHVNGGREQDTEYLLDGFEIGDPATGQLTSRVAVDSVRSVDTTGGAFSAQYPHGGASVLDLKTYLGDDHWRFGTTNFFPGISFQQGVNLGNWYPRFTVSGPIEQGRAWFSDGVSLQHTFSVISGLPKTGNTATQWSGDNWLRLQYNITPTHILQGNFLLNQTADSNLGLGVLTPVSATADLRSSSYFGSVKDQIAFQQGLFEYGASFYKGYNSALPQGSLPYVVTPDGVTGNYFQTLHQQTHRWQGIADLALPSRRWHGTHDLRMGLNVDNSAFAQQANRSPIESVSAANIPIQTTTFGGPSQFHLSNTQYGAYVQDLWQPMRMLLVQAGGRMDGNGIIGQTLWAPRLAVNVLPFRDGRSKLTVAWGLYYEPLDLSVFGIAHDQSRTDLFLGPGGLPGPVTSSFRIAAGLQQPYFDTASAGWQQKFGSATFFNIRGILRQEHNGLAYEFLPANPQGLGGEFLLRNNRRDEYRSVEVSLRRSFRNAEIFGSYTRSLTRSNEPFDFTLANPVSLLATPLFTPQVPGALPWDAPNRFLSYGWTPIPFWGLLVSYNLEYRTGYPYGIVTPYQQLAGPPDQFRFPSLLSLDVGIEKRFHFHGHEWAARMAMVNATDHQNPNSVNNIEGSPRTYAGGQARAFTARIRLVGKTGAGGTPSFGPNPPPSPFPAAGQPSSSGQQSSGGPGTTSSGTASSGPPGANPAPEPPPAVPAPTPSTESVPMLTAGLYGNTGLWKVFTADTLPVKQISFETSYDRINRNPGDLTIGTAGLGGAIGITKRLELGVDLEANRDVQVGRPDQLSFGQQALGFFGNKTPGSPPLPAELAPGSSRVPQLRYPATPAGALTGAAGYYDLLPFAGLVSSGSTVGLIEVGAKFSVLSESSGAPVGLAVHAYLGVPIHKSIDFLLTHPVGTADIQFGFDGIVSKNIGEIAELYWNAGYRHINQPAHVSIFRLADEAPLGFGLTMPRRARIQFVAESTAEVFVGSHTPNTTFGAEDPVDVTLGLRAYLGRSFGLSGGYRRPVNQFGGDKNGFVVSLTYAYSGLLSRRTP